MINMIIKAKTQQAKGVGHQNLDLSFIKCITPNRVSKKKSDFDLESIQFLKLWGLSDRGNLSVGALVFISV